MREIISSTLRMTATKKSKYPNTNQLFSIHFEFLKVSKLLQKIYQKKTNYTTHVCQQKLFCLKTQKIQYPNINKYFGFFGL